MEQEAITAALSSLEKAPPVKPSEAFKATKFNCRAAEGVGLAQNTRQE
jgi:hypothetical protein